MTNPNNPQRVPPPPPGRGAPVPPPPRPNMPQAPGGYPPPMGPVQPVQPGYGYPQAPAYPPAAYPQGPVYPPAPGYPPMQPPIQPPIQPMPPMNAPPPMPAPNTANVPTVSDLSSAAAASNEAMTGDVPERDRIVVIGRRQSGKTIYLASIYAQLWRSTDGITAKALSGDVHRQLMAVHQILQSGRWPPSTLGTSQIDLEIDYHGKRRLLVSLDFAGELFAKAFLEDQHDWPGVKELCNHIDRAAAVLLLVDPSVAVGKDKQAAMEDDFGMVQAVQRIRNWVGGDQVPIVLVLTKMDQHQHLLDQSGGSMEYLRRYFPAMLRLLKQLPVVQISCVQTETGPDGKPRPRPESTPVNLDHPLRYCLREIEKAERRAELDAADQTRRAAEAREVAAAHSARKRVHRNVMMGVGAISAVGSVLVGLILYFNI